VGHVDPRRLAPFGDDYPLVHDHAGQVATILDRADRLAERLAPAEGLVVVELEVARVLDLAGDRKVDRRLQELRVDAGLRRRLARPIGARNALGLRRAGQQGCDQRAHQSPMHPTLHGPTPII
jgi:hypothetical protein